MSLKSLNILLVAGYGGHSGYVYAVALELSKVGFKNNVFLVAEEYSFLAEKFKDLGRVYYHVLPRRPGEPVLKDLGRWMKAFYQSFRLLLKENTKVVFAGGSNFSVPPSLVATVLRRAKVYTIEAIEHFSKPSRAIKFLEFFGAKVFLHWEEQLGMFPRGIVVGPVYEPPVYEPRDEGYVLVTTGTIGYKELFDSIEKLKLNNVVIQTGDVDPEPYLRRNPSWKVFRYTSDIHRWIAGASIVITQQGVTAATASLAYGKPVVVVWNPRVVLGAPKNDVKIYAEKLEAVFIERPDVEELKRALELAHKPTRIYPNAARTIAKILVEELK
ncbi:MAG: glycosyltransferase [Desulfurococcaceae archaeon]